MKRIVVVVMMNLFQHLLVEGQNLVPNPSFEDTTSCPNNYSQIYLTPPWNTPSLGSPDYFNSCNSGSMGTPNNTAGSENPRTGSAYAGFGAFGVSAGATSDSVREYIQAPLNNNLIQGVTYYVSFYVSLAEGFSVYAVNNLGAYFSATAVSSANYNPLHYLPQIENTSSNPLTNTNGWTKVSGQFIAQGGERYITIGNFNSNTKSDTVFIKAGGALLSYYYIDDVSVIATTIGINELSKETEITISPNPFTSQTTISFSSEQNNTIIKVINVIGEIIAQSTINGKQYTLDLSSASKGIYFLQITDEKKTVVNRKVVVE